ncbi:deoxyhypusine synthase [Nanoarchaeota archaeon]
MTDKPIIDFDLDENITVKDLLAKLKDSGFQAQQIGRAADVIRAMKKAKAKVFLSFTSNIAASGLRGLIAQLIKEGLVNVISTSSGTIDEDFIKSNKPYLQGSFDEEKDTELGKKGINRMGNVYVPNDRYTYLEDEMPKILEKAYAQKKTWLPSELIKFVGENMKEDSNSILWQAAKNNVPIFCPALTDGAFGMQLMFFQQKHQDFEVSIVKDFKNIIDQAANAEKTAGIILGGATPKHHAIIANLMREGFDYCIYVKTSSPYTGSLSGATTSEAKSWGKVNENAKAVTVHSDVTIVFPLLAAVMLEK